MTAGVPRALPWPKAQKPKERSSMQGTMRVRGCCAIAVVSGDDLDPARNNENLHYHGFRVPASQVHQQVAMNKVEQSQQKKLNGCTV
jgi:hypothetical protein